MAKHQNERRIPDVQYTKGERVFVVTACRGYRVRGSGSTNFSKGESLIVVSSSAEFVRVRRDLTYGYVFSVDSRLIAPVDRKVRYLGDAPEGSIRADDPRLDYLWADAARAATVLGFCEEFDRIAAVLGIPGRERSYSVSIEVAPGVRLSGREKARSLAEAEQLMVRRVRTSSQAQLALGASS